MKLWNDGVPGCCKSSIGEGPFKRRNEGVPGCCISDLGEGLALAVLGNGIMWPETQSRLQLPGRPR